MTPAPAGKGLDAAGFERLLAFLDADREAAAAKYEDVRRRLVKLYAWRGCSSPDLLADDTFDRVARRLRDGADVRVADPYQYFYGVAQNVLLEHWRDPSRQWAALTDNSTEGASGRGATEDRPDDRERSERRLTCLESCLSLLSQQQRELVMAYHAGGRHIERRQEIAKSLGIPTSALRIRVHRLRARLAVCVERCAAAGRNQLADPALIKKS
jgi:RNA polymerase sigma factor (sigma-70 family)